MSFETNDDPSFRSSPFDDLSDFKIDTGLFNDTNDVILFGENNLPRQHKTQEFLMDFSLVNPEQSPAEIDCQSMQPELALKQPTKIVAPAVVQEPQPELAAESV